MIIYFYLYFIKYKFFQKLYFKTLNFKILWGLGIGDWGLGIEGWGLGSIPNPQSPIPNPQSPIPNPQIKIIITK